MSTVVFTSGIDMSALNLTDWFINSPTNTSSSSMTFEASGETAVVSGSHFIYANNVPVFGTVSSVSATGLVNVTISDVSISVLDIYSALASSDPAKEMTSLWFGGRDKITGSDSTDILYGFGGGDRISGGHGADFIVGGAGADRLSGGGGIDTFSYESLRQSTNAHPDLIVGLQWYDVINLSGLGVQSLDDIAATYDADSNRTSFAIDADGDGDADMTIRASGDQTDFHNFVI